MMRRGGGVKEAEAVESCTGLLGNSEGGGERQTKRQRLGGFGVGAKFRRREKFQTSAK